MDSVTATKSLRILGIASLVALPKSFYTSLFRGLQRMEFNNIIDVITTGMQQFGTIFILVLGGDIFLVIYWFATCYLLRIISYIALLAKFFPLHSLIPGFSVGVIKRNIKFATSMMIVSITGVIHTQADKIIISKLMPIGVVGYYGFAYASISKARLFTGSISQAIYPSFSSLFKSGQRDALMSQYHKYQDLLCFGILPFFALVPFAFLPIFSYMFNEEIARLLFLPSTLLSLGFFLNGTMTIPYVFSLAVGKPEIAARQHLYDLFITLPVTLFLIYYLGLIGAGLSLVFFNLFHYLYGIRRTCSECLNVTATSWYYHIIKILVIATLTYGSAWIFLATLDINSLYFSLVSYILGSLFYFLGSYFLISKQLRKALLKYTHFLRLNANKK